MKKILLVASVLLVLAGNAFAAIVTEPVISAEARTNTKVLIKITTLPTADVSIDSTDVCYFLLGATDTLFASSITSTTKNKVLTGFTPGKAYAFFVRVRDDTLYTAISNIDTVTMYYPEIEATPDTKELFLTDLVATATSWRPDEVTTTFTFTDSSGEDSTCIFIPWENNSISVVASQAGDSVNVTLYTRYGYREMTQKGTLYGATLSGDSLNITSPGFFHKTLTANTAYPSMYFYMKSYNPNGKNASLTLYLNRRRY